jgi:hypothetical protein
MAVYPRTKTLGDPDNIKICKELMIVAQLAYLGKDN